MPALANYMQLKHNNLHIHTEEWGESESCYNPLLYKINMIGGVGGGVKDWGLLGLCSGIARIFSRGAETSHNTSYSQSIGQSEY